MTDTLAAEGRRRWDEARKSPWSPQFRGWLHDHAETLLSALEERDRLRELLKEAVANWDDDRNTYDLELDWVNRARVEITHDPR